MVMKFRVIEREEIIIGGLPVHEERREVVKRSLMLVKHLYLQVQSGVTQNWNLRTEWRQSWYGMPGPRHARTKTC